MATIERLIGVYDADGTLRGEVAYWIGARLGRGHCSLCDVTHGTFTEKLEWKRCRSALSVPFDTYHRDDQPEGVRRASGDTAPVVLAETAEGFVLILDDKRISSVGGDPSRLVELIMDTAQEAALDWPA